ncbi:AAA family ATPase [Sphingomonadaceae bacterium jetA1]|jgi:ATP-dependent exoDNAse (exonuclease V) alpha subunit|uniref:ATP-dependent DNA helicase n=1 Tax=Facivitalis istanbulensis TaxID=3075838 RepID=UPI003474730A
MAVLERAAGDAGRGRVAHADILAAIARARHAEALVPRAVPRAARGVAGFATREGVETERRMLALEAGTCGTVALLADRFDAGRIIGAAELRSAEHGHRWTKGQRDATRDLLLSPHGVTGIQDSAGTPKTTTVLATYADAARDQGFEVRALAPTATAAAVLGNAIGAEHMTFARMLSHTSTIACAEHSPEVWAVDETSMLGARDAEALLAQARAQGARLVLVGDVDQLGSVEAGRAFSQLQDDGMFTPRLDEIVRQTNPHTRAAVEAMLDGDAQAAFDALDAGGGRVVEQPDTQTRQAVLARDFAALSREERARTLVLDPTRQGRQELTDAIRAALITDGTLGEDAMVARVLEPRGLTRTEARLATSYQPSDIVAFRKSEKGRPRAGIGYRVESVDAESGAVRLVPDKGKTHDWQPARWGAAQAEAFVEVEQEFRAGDRVQFTRNNYRADRLNGQTAEVVAIDPAGSSMVVEREDGRRDMLDLRHLADRHIRHGWVRTIHSSQGATCERVMAHLESFRAKTVDAASVYVAISRARTSAAVYIDSRASPTDALGLRDGAQVGAVDETLMRCGPGIVVDSAGPDI